MENECNQCGDQFYVGQDTVYELEGQASYCSKDCLVLHIRKNAWEYLELLEEQGLVENSTHR